MNTHLIPERIHMLLANKNIIVIGGSGGLGEAAVTLFLQQGANVWITGLEENYNNQTLSSNCRYSQLELMKTTEVNQFINEVSNELGVIHGLYHIAGGSGRKKGDGPLHLLPDEAWEYTLNLNLRSIMTTNRAIIQYWMEHQLPGSILNMGSILASSPSPEYFASHAYAAAKSGIEGFSKSLAAYYAKHHIRINVLAPGLISTSMSNRAQKDIKINEFIKTKQPLRADGIGRPEDCSGAALFFMSDYSSFITGEILHVDGGWHLSDGQYFSSDDLK